jgi:hypothetical protein
MKRKLIRRTMALQTELKLCGDIMVHNSNVNVDAYTFDNGRCLDVFWMCVIILL